MTPPTPPEARRTELIDRAMYFAEMYAKDNPLWTDGAGTEQDPCGVHQLLELARKEFASRHLPTAPTQPPDPLAGGTEACPHSAQTDVIAGCKEGRPVSPATGEREAELREAVGVIVRGIIAGMNQMGPTIGDQRAKHYTDRLLAALTPLLDRREAELSQHWRLSSVCREKEAEHEALKRSILDLTHPNMKLLLEEAVALRTLVAKQGETLKAIRSINVTEFGTEADAAINRLIDSSPNLVNIADELAAKDARIRELEGHHQRDEELLVQRTAVLTAAQSALREAEATNDSLRRSLDDPPLDVQELVIKRLNLVHRDALTASEAARNAIQEYLDQRQDTPQHLWSKQRYAREIERQQGMLNAARAQEASP